MMNPESSSLFALHWTLGREKVHNLIVVGGGGGIR